MEEPVAEVEYQELHQGATGLPCVGLRQIALDEKVCHDGEVPDFVGSKRPQYEGSSLVLAGEVGPVHLLAVFIEAVASNTGKEEELFVYLVIYVLADVD